MAAILANLFMWLSCLHGLNLEPSYFTQLCIYTGGYLQGRNYASINNILKVMHFLSHLTYMPKILIGSFGIHANEPMQS